MALNIALRQIRGDLVELVFNPREGDLRVGENLSLVERENGRGLIVQVIAFRTASYPALVREQLQFLTGEEPTLSPLAPLFDYLQYIPDSGPSDMGNIKVAIAKIRKTVYRRSPLVGPAKDQVLWDEWDGWIPTRDIEITHTPDTEVFANCTRDGGNLLCLGKTLGGADFFVEGQDLEKVNVITGVKGSGKSHLAKVILLELIARGAPCLVFDINREYIHLPKHQKGQSGVIHLQAGGNFRLGVRQFGLPPMMTLLSRFGLPEVSAMHFENRLAKISEEMTELERQGKKPPFVGLDQLIQMAEEGEFSGGTSALAVNNAIRSRLQAVRNTRIFARNPKEAASLRENYLAIRNGGALVIDMSGLSNLAREGFVQAIIELIKSLCIWEIDKDTNRFPFLFFEEAHLYVSQRSIDYLITRSRHLGITSFFVTNMIGGLNEAVLRQADNLFLMRIPFEDDVRHVAKAAATDFETLESFVRRLRRYHALLVGEATAKYPLIFSVDPLAGVNTAGETKFFFIVRSSDDGRQSEVDTTVPIVADHEGYDRACPESSRGNGQCQLPLLALAEERCPEPVEGR
jgi:hypothetical protein